ncbi:MAG: aminotransferase class I/II-fold pyridoxal phosphate-dependent enzyme [Bacteroidia bacterium]
MSQEQVKSPQKRFSTMVSELKGSEIIRLAGEINDKIKSGQKIYNFTIGDFNPNLFPLPDLLKEEIIRAYTNNETNYPAANGIQALREAVSDYIFDEQGLKYTPDEFLIAGGARPLIYAAFQALVDAGDKVLFPVPSWNNNHYSHLTHAEAVMVETRPENNFMPKADDLRPYISEVSMLALCSPLNPTGTVFNKEDLREISELVLEENLRRSPDRKPLFLLYDQIYWMLTYGDTKHYDPVSLVPALKPYTIYIDGISKSFSATGVRVGWAFGPDDIIGKMRSILGHIGAWSPKAEQVATSKYLENRKQVKVDLEILKSRLNKRLDSLHESFQKLKEQGFPVDSIAPAGAIYLTVKFDLLGKITDDGKEISSSAEVTSYLLNDAGLAIVPFYAFGASNDSTWFRLSVGTLVSDEISLVMDAIKRSIQKLH